MLHLNSLEIMFFRYEQISKELTNETWRRWHLRKTFLVQIADKEAIEERINWMDRGRKWSGNINSSGCDWSQALEFLQEKVKRTWRYNLKEIFYRSHFESSWHCMRFPSANGILYVYLKKKNYRNSTTNTYIKEVQKL